MKWTRWYIYLASGLLLASCAHAPKLPPEAPEAVKVLVPVAKPCVVEKATRSPLPSAGAQPLPNDIYELTKLALADRAVLLGDREQATAATSDPCPTSKP